MKTKTEERYQLNKGGTTVETEEEVSLLKYWQIAKILGIKLKSLYIYIDRGLLAKEKDGYKTRPCITEVELSKLLPTDSFNFKEAANLMGLAVETQRNCT